MHLNLTPLMLLKYWIFQGVLYMNRVELMHRFALEVIIVVPLYYLFYIFYGPSASVVLAFVIGHTLSAIFNGHPFAVLAHDVYMYGAYKTADKFICGVERIADRLERKSPSCLREVLVFGSVTRGVFRETSDLDIRYIAMPGFWNSLCAAHYVFIERLRACFDKFPIDAYMFRDGGELARKMRVDHEPAITLYRNRDIRESLVNEPRPFVDMKEAMKDARPEKKPPRVLVIGAGGGHLTEGLLATEGVPMRRVIATFKLPHTRGSLTGERIYFLVDPHGNLLKYGLNLIQSLWMILRERPDAIVNTGGGMTIAASLLGKLFGSRLIYVESGARVETLSRTGGFLYKYADLFLVQWRPLLSQYPRAIYGGSLL